MGLERHRLWIQDLAARLATNLVAAGEFDLWAQYALPLAGRTTCHIVGIPEADSDTVTRWALDLVVAFGALSARQRSGQFRAYLDELLQIERRDPGNGIVSHLATDPDSPLSPAELRGLTANVTFGGLDAIAKSITTGVHHLLEQDQWSRLVGEPDLIGTATEEVVRSFPPTGAAIRHRARTRPRRNPTLGRQPVLRRGVTSAAAELGLIHHGPAPNGRRPVRLVSRDQSP